MDKQSTASEFQGMLEARGVSRRSFMKLCGTLAVMAGLGEAAAPRVAQALEESVIGASQGDLYPVIWIEGASCTGCTEAFAQIDAPDAAAVVLELISLNYSETQCPLLRAIRWEKAKEQTIEAGNYILVYEGAVLNGWNGNALRVAGKTGNEHLIEAAEKATAVVALGSCAVNGGWMAAAPNASNATGVQAFLRSRASTCPSSTSGLPAEPRVALRGAHPVPAAGRAARAQRRKQAHANLRPDHSRQLPASWPLREWRIRLPVRFSRRG